MESIYYKDDTIKYTFHRNLISLEYSLSRYNDVNRKLIALDAETTGLNPLIDKLLLLQLYVPETDVVDIIDCRELDMDSVTEMLYPFLSSDEWLKLGHNIGFDYGFILSKMGIKMARFFDTMIAEQVLDTTLPKLPKLSYLTEKYLNIYMSKEVRNEFIGLPDDESITHEQLVYSAIDVIHLEEIMMLQARELTLENTTKVARLEFAILPRLIESSFHGVMINPEKWKDLVDTIKELAISVESELIEELQPYIDRYRNKRYKKEIKEYKSLMATYTMEHSKRNNDADYEYEQYLEEFDGNKGLARKKVNLWKKAHPNPKKPKTPIVGIGPINIGSWQQLQGALSEAGVKLPPKENGMFETDKNALLNVKDEYPLVGKLLRWRGLSKLSESFGDNILALVDSNNRLHPRFRQLVSTGRMSCSEPNVQQVPANEVGGKLRDCFIASKGYKLVAADYSNIELRILAEIANETNMLEAFEAGVDLHSVTASKMFNIPIEDVKDKYPEKRKTAKIINFGVAYGQGAGGFARTLQITYQEAKGYITDYFQANPNIDYWLKVTGAASLRNGYSSTVLGRKRYFKPINMDEVVDQRELRGKQKAIERQGCNHPIQGTSADITKTAILLLFNAIEENGLDAMPVMYVHDEIVVEVKEEEAEMLAHLMEKVMIQAAQYYLKEVKIEVKYEIGDHWIH